MSSRSRPTSARPASTGKSMFSTAAPSRPGRPMSGRLSTSAASGKKSTSDNMGDVDGEPPKPLMRGTTVRSPIRRPVSKIGKSMGKFLDEFYGRIDPYSPGRHSGETQRVGSPPPTSRPRASRSPSPTRKSIMRMEAEREAAATKRGVEVERMCFCSIKHSQPVRNVVLGEGNVAYTAGKDGHVMVWDVGYLMSSQGPEVAAPDHCKRVLTAQSSGVSCMCVVDKRWLCTGGWNTEVRVWDTHDSQFMCMGTLKGHSEFVRSVVGMDGQLFTGSNDRTIKVWDIEKMECIGMMAGHSLAIVCLTISGGLLYSGGYDFAIKVWDIESRQCVAELGGHTQVITDLVVAHTARPVPVENLEDTRRKKKDEAPPDPRIRVLLSCAQDMMLRVWSTETYECVREISLSTPDALTATGLPLTGSECHPRCMCVDSNGLLFVGSREGQVQVWDLELERCVSVCSGHTESVRCLAILYSPPFLNPMLLSASDDGTVKAWKDSSLVRREKDGMLIEAERLAQAEALAKHRAKEFQELERQRLRESVQQAKAEADEVQVRASVQHANALGNMEGTDRFADWGLFQGELSHKFALNELTVWSMGHVHGIQSCYCKDGQKRRVEWLKGAKAAFDLGKGMPTANHQPLSQGEDITEISVFVSKTLVPGVIGQLTIRTTLNSEGYKFGRTTDGDEQILATPQGYRALCLHGTYGEQGLREIGVTFIPKVERKHTGGTDAVRPFTVCSRHRASLHTVDGRILAIDPDTGRLVAVPPEHLFAAGAGRVFTIEGQSDGDGIALSMRNTKGERFLSVDKATGFITAKFTGWSVTAAERFEVEKHSTDEGDRLSLRAYNGLFLTLKTSGRMSVSSNRHTFVMASAKVATEDDLFGIVRNGIESAEVCSTLLLGKPTREEREEMHWVEDAKARVQAVSHSQAISLMRTACPPLSRVACLKAHPFAPRPESARTLSSLPGMLSAAAVENLGGLLENLCFLSSKGAVLGVPSVLKDLVGGRGVLAQLAEFLKTEEGVQACSNNKFIEVLHQKKASLGPDVVTLLRNTQLAFETALERASDAAASGGFDLVNAVRSKEQVASFVECGASILLRDISKLNDVMAKLNGRIELMKEFPEDVFRTFCTRGYLLGSDSSLAFQALAAGLTSMRDADEASLTVYFNDPTDAAGDDRAVSAAIKTLVERRPELQGAGGEISVQVLAIKRSQNVKQGALGGEGSLAKLCFTRSPLALDESDPGAHALEIIPGPVQQQHVLRSGGEGEADRVRGSDVEAEAKAGEGVSARNTPRGAEGEKALAGFGIRSLLSIRDEVSTAVANGSLAPLITDVAPPPMSLSAARLLITGDGMKEERSILHRTVLPALRSWLLQHAVDLTWVDFHWGGGAEDACAIAAQGGGSVWSRVVEAEKCIIECPVGMEKVVRDRPFALVLAGEGSENVMKEEDARVLGARRPKRYGKAVEGLTMVEVLLKMCTEGGFEEKEALCEQVEEVWVITGEGVQAETEATEAEAEEKAEREEDEEGKQIVDTEAKIEDELEALDRGGGTTEGKGNRHDDNRTSQIRRPTLFEEPAKPPPLPWPKGCHVGVLAHRLGSLDQWSAGLAPSRPVGPVLAAIHHAHMPAGDVCEEVASRHEKLKNLMKSSARARGARSESVVHVGEAKVGGGGLSAVAAGSDVYLMRNVVDETGRGPKGKMEVERLQNELFGFLNIEFPSAMAGVDEKQEGGFSLDDVDQAHTYLCDKGHRGVVTYTNKQGAFAAALATQKTTIRTAVNLHCVVKGCPEMLGGRVLCDDPDMTLVEVFGVPAHVTENELYFLFSCPLKEVTVIPGDRVGGEGTGAAGVTYESHEAMLAVKMMLEGVEYPCSKRSAGALLRFSRHESDTPGFINVKGLPWDVTSEEVRSFFEILPIPKWSCCRPASRNGHAILAFPFRFAAIIVVQRCNGSRLFGAVPLDVAVVNPDHAKRRVFCSGLPFAFSEKAAVDVERMVKDVQAKERELANHFTILTAYPIPALSRLFTRRVGPNLYEFVGDAVAAYPHPLAAKAALAAIPTRFKPCMLPPNPLSRILRRNADLAAMALQAFEMLRSTVARHHPPMTLLKVTGGKGGHAMEARDQESMLERVARASCVGGCSGSQKRREALVKFLREMCALFRGVEDEWVKVQGDGRVRDRHELSHVGDGVRCGAFKALCDAVAAVQEGKGALVVVFGVAGCGKTSMVARFVLAHRTTVAKNEAEMASEFAKKGDAAKKKRSGVAMGAPAKLGGTTTIGGTKAGTAKKKQEKKEDSVPVHPPTTRVVCFLRQPWHSFDDAVEFVLRELWAPWSLPFCEKPGADEHWAMELRSSGGGVAAATDVLQRSLAEFLSSKYNQTIGIVLDSLTEEECSAVAVCIVGLRTEMKPINFKVWVMASLSTASDDNSSFGDDIRQVKVPPLSKPDATCIIFDIALREGPHLLRMPIRLLMGMLKNGSESPRYLGVLVSMISRRGIFDDISRVVEGAGSSYPSLLSDDLLPALECEHNAGGTLFRIPRGPRGGTPGITERVFKVMLGAGVRGFSEGDVADCLSEPIPDYQRVPLMRAVGPLLHTGLFMGQNRYALVCPFAIDAITARYWPTAYVIRGTGCNQLTQKLPPMRPPTHMAFGKLPGVNPLFVVDVTSPKLLHLIKRLFVRLLVLHTSRDGKDGRATGQRFLTLNFIVLGAEDTSVFSQAMTEVDDKGECVARVIKWLKSLESVPVPAPKIAVSADQATTHVHAIEGGPDEGGLHSAANRPGWTRVMEVMLLVGRGCDAVHWMSDSSPTQSVDRIMDEVEHLEREGDFRVPMHCVSLDAPLVGDKALKKLAGRTGGRFTHVSCYLLEVLLNEPPEDRLKERIAHLEGQLGVSLRSSAHPSRVRAGSCSGVEGIMVPPPRALVSVVKGEADDILPRVSDVTSRGLRVTVFDRQGAIKLDKTYDTWGSIAESQRLAEDLSVMQGFEFVAVTSFDAWELCFSHHAANELSKCGIDGRRMLKKSEIAKISWDVLSKRSGKEPNEEARPEGHGHPFAAVGIKGRKPWGRTILQEDLTLLAPVAEIVIDHQDIVEMRALVEERESLSERSGGRAVGVCKVITPFRWSHEAGHGPYNTLPGHSSTSPSKEEQAAGKVTRIPPEDRSLNSATFSMELRD